MKRYTAIILTLSCIVGLIWSCSKKIELVSSTTPIDGLAYIKITQVSPNFRGVFNKSDSFNIYVNNVKLNGAFLTYGSTFPSTTNLYAAVAPGTATIRLTVNGTTTPDSVNITTITKTLTAGSYYSFILTDSLLNSSEAKQIFVQDNFARTDTTHFTMRFAHTILNDTAGKNVDIYSTRQGGNMFSNISPGTVTPFNSQNYNYIADTLIVRRAGTTFELARVSTVSLPIARERAYTLIYRGMPAVTTGAKARSLVYFANQ